MTEHSVTVDLGERSYRIDIGAGLLHRLGTAIADAGGRRAVLIADPVVDRLHGDKAEIAIAAAGIDLVARIALPMTGEGAKGWDQAGALLDRLLALGLDRKTMLIALGGGVTGDLVGFVAATALRGVPFLQVPTTLLAQVDSSVGGKTGVNSPHGKNLIGAFYQPVHVLIDLETLDSLPRRDLLAGYAEVVKYAALGDPEFFTWLEANGAALLAGDLDARAAAVERSCAAKAAIVAADEREAGQRALLNLGHTFGHALEAATGYDDRLLHGEGVAIGMAMAFDLSVRLGICSAEDRGRLVDHLTASGLPTDLNRPGLDDLSADRLFALMAADKKAEAGWRVFVVADGIGKARVDRAVPEDAVRATLVAAGAKP